MYEKVERREEDRGEEEGDAKPDDQPVAAINIWQGAFGASDFATFRRRPGFIPPLSPHSSCWNVIIVAPLPDNRAATEEVCVVRARDVAL